MTLDLAPLDNAIARQREGLERYAQDTSDALIRDGLIQRFELTYEIAHRTLKRYLESVSASPEEYDAMPFQDLIRSGNEQGATAGRLAALARVSRHARTHGAYLRRGGGTAGGGRDSRLPGRGHPPVRPAAAAAGMTGDAPPIAATPAQWRIVCDVLQAKVPQWPVWAFGSRATRRAKPYSDLDIAVVADAPLGLALLAELGEAFSESDLPWKVDVVDWATTSERFRRVIERDRVVVQEGLGVQHHGRNTGAQPR